MNVDTDKMAQYAQFLNETSQQIVKLCNDIEQTLLVAVQCMDQVSGRMAAGRMAQSLETIKKNVPIGEEASKRLELSRKYIIDATNVFGR